MKPYYEDEAVTIYHGDCREILPTLGEVDLVLTDPPYGRRAAHYTSPRRPPRQKDGHLWVREWGKMVGDDTDVDVNALLALGGDAVVWGGNHFAGLPAHRTWFAWDKGEARSNWSGSDGDLAFTTLTGGGVRMFRLLWNGFGRGAESREHYHPTQKPVLLMRWCIEQVPSNPQTILDPFMGSGPTLRAAKDLGRKAIGIEIEEKYCEIAAERMRTSNSKDVARLLSRRKRGLDRTPMFE